MDYRGSFTGVQRVARIDLAAFASNIARLLVEAEDFELDARANAYGHGLREIVPAALDLGVSTVRVSPFEANLVKVTKSRLSTVATVRRQLIGAAAFGLDEVGTPVLTLIGEVIAVKPTEAGAGVSYGYSFRTQTQTTLALVGLGYADGVPRLASNRTAVHIGGSLYPLVGRVAMDQFVVDCGASAPKVGDEVVVLGDPAHGHSSAVEWATHTERSALELTAGLGSRIQRVRI